jgi:hypothetical protein
MSVYLAGHHVFATGNVILVVQEHRSPRHPPKCSTL